MAIRRRARDVVRLAWARWKVVAHVIVPPFALIVKLGRDPLGLRPPRLPSFWTDRPQTDAAAARRQF